MKMSFRTDSKEVRSVVEQINNQYITVGEYLQNIIQTKNEEKGSKAKLREYMQSQRSYCWEVWRASNLVQSLLLGIPIPEITVYRQDDKSQYRSTIDGNQRLTSIYLFINNQFKLDLSRSIFPNFEIEEQQYTYQDLQNKTFSELPELFQDIILNYDLRITTINNCTEEEAERFFVSMNAGVKPLRPAEIRKAAMGSNVRNLFSQALESDWVLHCLTPKTATGNVGNEIMAQVITLLYHQGAVELSKENIDKVIYSFRQDGVPENLQNDIINICNYLNDASAIWIDNKKKADDAQTVKRGKRVANYATYRFPIFNKTNIIMLMIAANEAVKNNTDIEAFADWSLKFFKEPSQDYKNGLEGKVTELQNVDMRILAIQSEINSLEVSELESEPKEQEFENENVQDIQDDQIQEILDYDNDDYKEQFEVM